MFCICACKLIASIEFLKFVSTLQQCKFLNLFACWTLFFIFLAFELTLCIPNGCCNEVQHGSMGIKIEPNKCCLKAFGLCTKLQHALAQQSLAHVCLAPKLLSLRQLLFLPLPNETIFDTVSVKDPI